MHELFDLSGKTALVTGGGRGLGRDMAMALAQAGANLVIPDIIGELAVETAADIRRQTGRRALSLVVDVSDVDSVDRCFAATREEYGGLDVLVNNAGIGVIGGSEQTSRLDWQRTFDVNVTGLFHCCQHAGRLMLQQGHGKIINIASVYALVGVDDRLYIRDDEIVHHASAYNASKGAVISLTRSLAVEWAPRGVHVNAIAPGMMNTGKSRAGLGNRTWDNLAERTPLRRWGTGADLRGAVVFLASAASDFITGHVLVVDGGWTAW